MIRQIVVDIDTIDGPNRFFDVPCLYVRIRTDDKRFGFTQALPHPEDWESRFDVYWDLVGRKLKESMQNDSDGRTT